MVHPLQTESVTYVIQRAESMTGLFYLLTLYCTIRSVGTFRRNWWFAGAMVSCALGMGSKEIMVTAPLVVLLYDRIFLSGSFRETLARRWGLYLGLALTWVIPVLLIWLGPRSTTAGFGADVSALNYGMTQFGVVSHYLGLAFWPRQLCLDYGWPWAQTAGDIVPWAILIGALLGATVFALMRCPRAGFLGAAFFIILAPSSSFIPVADPIFEHRMYLSLAALVVLVVAGLDLLLKRVFAAAGGTGARALAGELIVLGVIVAAMAAPLTWRTLERNDDYRDEFSIWLDCLRTNPDNARVYQSLGGAAARADDLAGALKYLNRSIALKPDDANAHFNLGLALISLGRVKDGIAEYDKAIECDPKLANARNNLAMLYATHSDPQFRNGPAAVRLAEEACRIKDYEDPATLDTLSCAYAEVGRFKDAVRLAQAAIEQARERDEVEVIPEIDRHLRSFEAGKPWRELPKPQKPGRDR
jgi:cytochrome c-type biogenesis protein CcmH/NrfG